MPQGVSIHDKHIEVIVRQMLKRIDHDSADAHPCWRAVERVSSRRKTAAS